MTEEILNEEVELSGEEINELKKIRLQKLDALKADGKDPFRITSFDRNTTNTALKAYYIAEEDKAKAAAGDDEEKLKTLLDEIKANKWRIAGRILSKRDMGKASFIDVQDSTERLQVYVRKNDVGDESYADFKKFDIGDIVGLEGFVFRTMKGEISLHATDVKLLSKSLLPLPEKWHGLKDRDRRYRQRYVDLIVNPDVRKTFINRSKIISSIRRYLDSQGFIEVETPMLVQNAGGAAGSF